MTQIFFEKSLNKCLKIDNIMNNLEQKRGRYWFIKNRQDDSELREAFEDLEKEIEYKSQLLKEARKKLFGNE